MPMTVAELFVDLGVKGAATVGKSLEGVHAGLQKVADMSFAAKAGIFAAVVGLEELTRFSVGTAIDLKNFSGATGLSTEALQRWGYVAKMNNVPFEELAGTIKGLQSAQADMLLGKGAPEGALYFGIDPNKNPVEMFEQIQKKVREVGNDPAMIGLARKMAATLGISDNMFAMFRTGSLSMSGLTKEMTLTAREQEKLLALGREWSGFWMELKGQGQKSIANDLAGPITSFVQTLRGDVKEAGMLLKDLKRYYKSIDSPELQAGLKATGVALALALAPLAPYTAALIALAAVLDDLHKYREGKESFFGTAVASPAGQDIKKNGAGGFWDFLMGRNEKAPTESTAEEQEKYKSAMMRFMGFGPKDKNGYDVGSAGAGAGDTTVTNHIEIHGAGDPKAVAAEVQRQMNSTIKAAKSKGVNK